MNTRKVLIIIIITLAIVTLGAYVFIKNSSVGGTQNYYDKLANECRGKQSKNCCLASVRAMKAGNYTLAPQNNCPADYQLNMLKCIDSFRWCQPVEKSMNSI